MKAAASVNRPGADGGKEKKKSRKFQKGNLFNDPVVNLYDHLNAAETHIGNAGKSKNVHVK